MGDYSGFLTDTDREFLTGEKEYTSKQSRYQRRRSIRERTHAAFRDFTLLWSELDATEREKIFEPIADGVYHPHAVPERGPEPPESYQQADALKQGLIATFAFVYLGVRETLVPFEELVRAAVTQTEKQEFNRFVDVTVTIEATEPFEAIESAIAKLEAGMIEDLDYTEQQLLLAFIMDPETYPPSAERTAALERLNDLEQFSLTADRD